MSISTGYRVGNWGVQCCIDTTEQALEWPIVEFQGWTAFHGGQEETEIYLNGAKAGAVSFSARPDVEAAMGAGWVAVGWSTAFDIEQSARDNGQALVLEVRVRQQVIARKCFRYKGRFDVTPSPLKIVLHMPKTGGTSLRMALEEHRQSLFLLPLYNGDFTKINGLSSSSIDKVDVVFGHTSYGLHEHIARAVSYMTVLRNPYDFVSSLYFFAKYIQQDAEMLTASSITEALEKVRRPEFDNYYTRAIAGLAAELPVTDEHLEKAISNIDSHFSFVGLAERPRESLKRFSCIFGLPLSYMKENVTPDIVEREFVDPMQANQAIREHVRLDLKLYQYVVKKFWNMEIG